ncbi:MAG: coproporphyrinogen III oxidase family protein, partial [Oligoflexia bacterium]|nr:coproporphyrinogen III oxidase family protein [Oligoflexia bacterium]
RQYFQALRSEILLYKKAGFEFEGVYVGGGTPTIMIDELEKTLHLTCEEFPIKEISVETNPNHLNEKNIKVLLDCKVKRLSVGIQSFDDEILKQIKRYDHDKNEGGEAIVKKMKWVNELFHTVNADMIFNFPTQTIEKLNNDLNMLLSIGLSQVTYYPLMVSDFTKKQMVASIGTVDYKREKKYYQLITSKLQEHYNFSSAWCFTKKETLTASASALANDKVISCDEYIVNNDEYAGLGSGSIGYIGGICYANTFNIKDYIESLNNGKLPLMASKKFLLHERIRYDFMMKLFGMSLNINELNKKYGVSVWRYLWFGIFSFILTGGVKYKHGLLHLAKSGRYFWVVLMRKFFIEINNFRDFCREHGV